jgi:putative PIN family toxin of toxin-antitoxin system
MRVVLDTNVIVSALLSPDGIPAQILRYWEQGYFEMLVCQESLDELERVLRYPKIRKRLASTTNDELARLVVPFAEYGIWVSPH